MTKPAAILTLLFLCPLLLMAAGKSTTIVPKNGSPVTVIVGGKEKGYHSLARKQALRLEVEGPGKVLVQSRLILPAGTKSPVVYSIVVREKAQTVSSRSLKTSASDARTKGENAVLGKLRKFSVKVPPGKHAYDIVLETTNLATAAVKFSFVAPRKHRKLVSIEALSYNKTATAVVKERLIKYYVGTKQQDVVLRVVGPTRLRVNARLNYDAKMQGGQRFSVAVFEGDKQIQLKALSTTKSLSAVYKDWKEVSPAKTSAFSFDVPSGEHRYKFQLQAALANSVSLKFSVPKKDLKNEH